MSVRSEKVRGKIGEELAAQFLAGKGLTILERSARYGRGELDIVCRDGDEIVFVEVKTRWSFGTEEPEDLISVKQERMLKNTADWYLQERGEGLVPARFDIVTVEEGRDSYHLRHVKGTLVQ